ncbi:DUF6879 family protein [Streptomyces sp. NBC_00466]|uniref:DUF6879 family protein n=1 Tax=Streptomyces sp. NBC_00466 TaxID=2903655 RepID=UPI00352D539F
MFLAYAATEEYSQFRQGIAPPRDEGGPWFVNVREQTRRGKRIERVRLVDEPPTNGQRYLLATTPDNVAAGEDALPGVRDQWRHWCSRGGASACRMPGPRPAGAPLLPVNSRPGQISWRSHRPGRVNPHRIHQRRSP